MFERGKHAPFPCGGDDFANYLVDSPDVTRFELGVGKECAEVVVEIAGEGFDPRAVPLKLCEVLTSGRYRALGARNRRESPVVQTRGVRSNLCGTVMRPLKELVSFDAPMLQFGFDEVGERFVCCAGDW